MTVLNTVTEYTCRYTWSYSGHVLGNPKGNLWTREKIINRLDQGHTWRETNSFELCSNVLQLLWVHDLRSSKLGEKAHYWGRNIQMPWNEVCMCNKGRVVLIQRRVIKPFLTIMMQQITCIALPLKSWALMDSQEHKLKLVILDFLSLQITWQVLLRR